MPGEVEAHQGEVEIALRGHHHRVVRIRLHRDPVMLLQGHRHPFGGSRPVLDQEDSRIEAGLRRGGDERITHPEGPGGQGPLAQLVGHGLEADEAADPAEQGHVVDGFGQEIVSTRIEALQPVRRLIEGGDHHHGNMGRDRVALDPAADLEPVHARHHHVQQDDVAQALLADGDGIGAVEGCERVEIFEGELRLEEFYIREQVIDDEDAGRHATSLRTVVGPTRRCGSD